MATPSYQEVHPTEFESAISKHPNQGSLDVVSMTKSYDIAASLTKNLPLAQPPSLHSTVEGFMGGLKTLPKGGPARGRLITEHMNHGPFLSALKAHPQGQQVHKMLMTHLDSQANAGFRPGASVAMAKAWPKDEAENQTNAGANQVAQDHFMDQGAQLKVHNVQPNPAAKLAVGSIHNIPGFMANSRIRHEGQVANACVNPGHGLSPCGNGHIFTPPPGNNPKKLGLVADDGMDPDQIDESIMGANRGPQQAYNEDVYKKGFAQSPDETARPISSKWDNTPWDNSNDRDFWRALSVAAGLNKSLAKAWPKSPADNQANVEAHLVTQDHLQEHGKVSPHTNAKMARQADKIKWLPRTSGDMGWKVNTGYAEALGSNSKARLAYRDSIQPDDRSGTIEPVGQPYEHEFWSDTSRDAGIEPAGFLNGRYQLKSREATKNQFPTGSFDHIFEHLTVPSDPNISKPTTPAFSDSVEAMRNRWDAIRKP